MGFAEFLTLVFVVLKCTGYLAWSWWWVFSPIWITYSVVLLVIGGFFVFRPSIFTLRRSSGRGKRL